jgi:hypothetical protein
VTTLAVEEVAKFDRCASGIASEEIGHHARLQEMYVTLEVKV